MSAKMFASKKNHKVYFWNLGREFFCIGLMMITPSTALLRYIFNIQFCQSNGGHLAELDTAQKDTKINQHLDKNKYYWIGLKRIKIRGGIGPFVWTQSGKNVTYSLWWMDYNEPGGNGDCVFKDGFREDNIRQSFKGRLKEEL